MKNENLRKLVLTMMGAAMVIVLGYLNKLIPEMPQGGTVSIDIIAIFIIAYLCGVKYGLICGLLASLLQFVLGLATFYGWWSVLLDYVLPLMACGLAPLIQSVKIKSFTLYTGIIFAMTLKFACHYASGAFLFASYAPEGMNPLLYSLYYNLPYNLATLVVMLLLMPLVYPPIEKALGKR